MTENELIAWVLFMMAVTLLVGMNFGALYGFFGRRP